MDTKVEEGTMYGRTNIMRIEMEKYKVDALIEALDRVAGAIFSGAKHLGFNNTLTEMGALELMAMEIRHGSERIAGGLHAIAEAIAKQEDSDG